MKISCESYKRAFILNIVEEWLEFENENIYLEQKHIILTFNDIYGIFEQFS